MEAEWRCWLGEGGRHSARSLAGGCSRSVEAEGDDGAGPRAVVGSPAGQRVLLTRGRSACDPSWRAEDYHCRAAWLKRSDHFGKRANDSPSGTGISSRPHYCGRS